MPLNLFFKTDLINFLTTGGSYTPPDQWYVGMLGGGVEITGSWYARQAINFTAATATADPYSASSNEITFNMVTAASPDVTAFGLFDHVSTGNYIMLSDQMYPASISLTVGTVVKLNAGVIRVY